MFRSLSPSTESRNRRRVAFICGLLFEALVIGAAAFLGEVFPNELPLANKHYAVIWLPALTPPDKPVLAPPHHVAQVVVPKLKFPDPPKLADPAAADLEVPKIRHTIPSVPVSTVPPPTPPLVQTSLPAQEKVEVHTGLFGGAAEPVTTKRPVEEVQTGGFGDPRALPGRAQGDNPGNLPKLGSFGLPEGPGTGNGTGGFNGIRGVVASAGFGSGVAGMGNGHAGGGTGEPPVTVGDFEKKSQATPSRAESPRVPPPSEFQPLEILSKPSPVYTEEARRLKIQGEVALSVVFQANGAIRIIGVVKSLGHGLDQAAEQAATLIRFKPAQRSGQPADFPATLRIQFRLADQSS